MPILGRCAESDKECEVYDIAAMSHGLLCLEATTLRTKGTKYMQQMADCLAHYAKAESRWLDMPISGRQRREKGHGEAGEALAALTAYLIYDALAYEKAIEAKWWEAARYHMAAASVAKRHLGRELELNAAILAVRCITAPGGRWEMDWNSMDWYSVPQAIKWIKAEQVMKKHDVTATDSLRYLKREERPEIGQLAVRLRYIYYLNQAVMPVCLERHIGISTTHALVALGYAMDCANKCDWPGGRAPTEKILRDAISELW